MKPKISVMNLTNRPGGIDILWANMKRQTFQDFELILVDALWQEREDEVKAYINDPRLVYVRQKQKPEGALCGLAHADNQGFAACQGELIVCLQDYIWINPYGLEKYWQAYQDNPNILVTGVGHQYASPSKKDIVNPQGQVTVFDKPYTGKPLIQCWSDPRLKIEGTTFYMCYPQDWELNWASIPRKIIVDELGGMDEQYDYEGFAWDNVNIAIRADMLGYKAYIDQTNICMGFSHDEWWPNPLKVERKSPAEYHFKTMNEMAQGIRPIQFAYLK